MSFINDTARYLTVAGETPSTNSLFSAIKDLPPTPPPEPAPKPRAPSTYKGWKIKPVFAQVGGKGQGRPIMAYEAHGGKDKAGDMTQSLTGDTWESLKKLIDQGVAKEEKTPTQPEPTSEAVAKKTEEKTQVVGLTKKQLLIGGAATAGLLLLLR